MSLSALPTLEQLASMTSIADVRDDAEVATTVWNAASESLGNVTAVPVIGLVTLELFRQIVAKSCTLSRLYKDRIPFARNKYSYKY